MWTISAFSEVMIPYHKVDRFYYLTGNESVSDVYNCVVRDIVDISISLGLSLVHIIVHQEGVCVSSIDMNIYISPLIRMYNLYMYDRCKVLLN